MRLECLRIAVSLAASKALEARDVMPTAMSFYRWVQDEPPVGRDDITRLAEKFSR